MLYMKKLRSILRYLGTCDGNMEEGSLRCDANVSVRRVGDTALGTRCEIKNVNSMRFVGRAIEFEARRQVEILEGGGAIVQETRLFDSAKGETRSMRSKEEAHDYRYFPDPDLLPVELDEALIARIEAELPELPDQKKSRFMAEHGLSAYDAGVLVAEARTAEYFEAVARGRDAKQAANWVINDLFGLLAKAGRGIEASPVSAASLGKLLDLLKSDAISGRIAKDVFAIMFETGGDPQAIVEERGLKQVTDTSAIEAIVERLIADNPGQVATVQKNPKVAGWFTGQVMKATGGKANPGVVNGIVARKLGLG
jgi:aspartyl-tRNA(Asn)/glutamyl-tRNA(Gln) amidotransferase subunit B